MAESKIYRLKHLPTGLYWIKLKARKYSTGRIYSNLDEVGKIFNRKPSLNTIKYGYRHHLLTDEIAMGISSKYGEFSQYVESEWALVRCGVIDLE